MKIIKNSSLFILVVGILFSINSFGSIRRKLDRRNGYGANRFRTFNRSGNLLGSVVSNLEYILRDDSEEISADFKLFCDLLLSNNILKESFDELINFSIESVLISQLDSPLSEDSIEVINTNWICLYYRLYDECLFLKENYNLDLTSLFLFNSSPCYFERKENSYLRDEI